MATNAVLETVTIGAKSAFGFKVGDAWYNPRKPLSVDDFEKGKTYNVLTEKYSRNGKSGVNVLQIVGEPEALKPAVKAGTIPAPVTETRTGPEPVKDIPNDRPIKFGRTMSDYEMALDRRISRAGVYQAVLQSPALQLLKIKSEEDILAAVEKIAEAVLLKVGE
jgi:hypothetical protein